MGTLSRLSQEIAVANHIIDGKANAGVVIFADLRMFTFA
jgi:hypothetical protein